MIESVPESEIIVHVQNAIQYMYSDFQSVEQKSELVRHLFSRGGPCRHPTPRFNRRYVMHAPRPHQRFLPRYNRRLDPAVISTAASNLTNPALSNSIPRPLHQALNSLIRETNSETQLEVGRHIHTALEQSTDPTLRLRVAHVIETLHIWHVSDTNAALSLLSTLLSETLASIHTRDSAALAATLRTISSIASDALISKEEISRHVATLIPLIHKALFHPRPGHLDVYDSSATSATSDTGIPSRPTRVSSIRPHALAALHAVISAAPMAALPFWPLLIPMRAGIGRTAAPSRRTVAFLLLYEPDCALRTSAIALTTTLVGFAKPILRHRRTHPASSGATFAPSSERLLSGIVVLHSVLATALQTERVRTVIPRLSRLASDVLLSVNASAVPLTERSSLLSALADVLLASTDAVDLTARAAAGSALASAFSVLDPKDTYLEPEFLPTLCTRVVTALVTDSPGGPPRPVAELLCVLRNIVCLDVALFPCSWSHLAPFCRNTVIFGEESVSLHVTRLAETYVTTVLTRMTDDHVSCVGHVGERWTEQSIALSCEVYRHVLRHAVKHESHVVQSAAVVALDTLVQLLPVDKSENRNNHIRSTAEAVEPENTPSDALLEIIDSLLEISSSPVSTSSIRATAEKALGNLPVSFVGFPVCHRVLQSLQGILITCESGEDTIVLAKGLAAFGNITEKAVQSTNFGEGVHVQDILTVIMDVGLFAFKHLRTRGMVQTENQTASTRAAIDSSKVGAIHATAGFLVSAVVFSAEDCVHSPAWKDLEQDVRFVLQESFCDNGESVNVRCACGKAMGRVICSLFADERRETATGHGDETSTENLFGDFCATLVNAIGQKENARVEASAANALVCVVEKGVVRCFDYIALLRRCAQNLIWTAEQLQMLGVVDKSRGQYLHSQNCTTKLVCVILNSQCSSKMMVDNALDENTKLVIIEALCRFYAVPKFVTEKLVNTCHEDALRDVAEANPPVLLGDALPPEVGVAIQKVLQWSTRRI